MRRMETLLAESRVRRANPVNLREADRALFAHEQERPLPSVHLIELNDVAIDARGTIFHHHRPLPISASSPEFVPEYNGLRTRIKYAAQNFSRHKVRAPKTLFWFTDNLSHEYFHWLTDALPRLWLIRERIAGQPVWLPVKFRDKTYVRPALERFGITNVRFIEPAELLISSRLWVPEPVAPSGNYSEPVLRELHRLFVPIASPAPSERLYVSRARAPKRRIVNETEVATCLAKFGFRTVYLEELTWDEQVNLLARASHVIANHGAGLSNLLFAPASAAVLELRERTDAQNNCFYSLAAARGLDYYYQLCDSANPGEDLHTADIRVDLTELAVTVRQMIAGKSALS